MNIVFHEDEPVAKWAAEKLGLRGVGSFSGGFVRPFVAIGIADNRGELKGAVVFNGYDGFDIEMTVIGKGIFSRRLARVCSHYAFNQLKCVRMSATIRADNPANLEYCRRLGFSEEGIIRRKYGTVDAIRLGMLREECKWLNVLPCKPAFNIGNRSEVDSKTFGD